MTALAPYGLTATGDYFRHGTSGYTNHGCRCDTCRTAWNTYYRERYHRHKKVRCVGCSTLIYPIAQLPNGRSICRDCARTAAS